MPSITPALRILAVPVLAVALASVPVPSAADDRDDKAAEIVEKAPKDLPLEVVVTSRDSEGAPVIRTTAVKTKAAAVELVAKALGRKDTIGAEMNHRVTMAVYNDTFRSQQWALNVLKAETVHNSTTGGGVKVAVIDTGVYASHRDLENRVLSGRDFVNPGTSANDENGHGTHVAGIIAANRNNSKGIAGMAPGTKILPVRVLDRDGFGTSSGVANGIKWAADNGAKVINLSLESGQTSTAMSSAVQYAISKNVLVVAAAGNGGCGLLGGGVRYPAGYSGVVGAGSINQSIQKSSFSSCGSHVDVVAPGEGIISTMILSSRGLGCSSTKHYCTLSGTSFSSPYTAAAGALAIAKRGWSQATVASKLQSTATDLGPAGRDNSYGSGLINPLKLINN